jgi:tetratricopeptide (TPR) repeat protein
MAGTPDELMAEGIAARKSRRLPDARTAYAQAVALSRGGEDASSLVRALMGLGQIERDLGENGEALAHYLEAVEICRSMDDPLRLAHTVRHLADTLRHLRRLEEAKSCYEEALGIYRTDDNTVPLDMANAIRGFALLSTQMGDVTEARELWNEARDLYASVGVQAGVDESEERLALLGG